MLCAVCQKKANSRCGACNSTHYCSRECQKSDWKIHKKFCNSFVIKAEKEEKNGLNFTRRSIVAAKDLKCGSYILEEMPLFQIARLPCSLDDPELSKETKKEFYHVCSTCGDKKSVKKCDRCNWPVCVDAKKNCGKQELHAENECEILASKKIDYEAFDLEAFEDRRILLIVRAVAVKEKKPEVWNELMKRADEFSKVGQDSINNRVEISKLEEAMKKLKISKEDVKMYKKFFHLLNLTALFYSSHGEMDTLMGIQNYLMGDYLYPLSNYFSNSCAPNCNFGIDGNPDFKIEIRAARDVIKGEELTIHHPLIPLFQGTVERRKIIKERFGYLCKCVRCSDPTEFGTFFSGIVCQDCRPGGENQNQLEENSGYFLPFDPKSESKEEGKDYSPLVQCNGCKTIRPYSIFKELLSRAGKEFENKFKSTNIQELHREFARVKLLLSKYSGKSLHPNHFIIHKAHGFFSNNFGMDQPSGGNWDEKIKCFEIWEDVIHFSKNEDALETKLLDGSLMFNQVRLQDITASGLSRFLSDQLEALKLTKDSKRNKSNPSSSSSSTLRSFTNTTNCTQCFSKTAASFRANKMMNNNDSTTTPESRQVMDIQDPSSSSSSHDMLAPSTVTTLIPETVITTTTIIDSSNTIMSNFTMPVPSTTTTNDEKCPEIENSRMNPKPQEQQLPMYEFDEKTREWYEVDRIEGHCHVLYTYPIQDENGRMIFMLNTHSDHRSEIDASRQSAVACFASTEALLRGGKVFYGLAINIGLISSRCVRSVAKQEFRKIARAHFPDSHVCWIVGPGLPESSPEFQLKFKARLQPILEMFEDAIELEKRFNLTTVWSIENISQIAQQLKREVKEIQEWYSTRLTTTPLIKECLPQLLLRLPISEELIKILRIQFGNRQTSFKEFVVERLRDISITGQENFVKNYNEQPRDEQAVVMPSMQQQNHQRQQQQQQQQEQEKQQQKQQQRQQQQQQEQEQKQQQQEEEKQQQQIALKRQLEIDAERYQDIVKNIPQREKAQKEKKQKTEREKAQKEKAERENKERKDLAINRSGWENLLFMKSGYNMDVFRDMVKQSEQQQLLQQQQQQQVQSVPVNAVSNILAGKMAQGGVFNTQKIVKTADGKYQALNIPQQLGLQTVQAGQQVLINTSAGPRLATLGGQTVLASNLNTIPQQQLSTLMPQGQIIQQQQQQMITDTTSTSNIMTTPASAPSPLPVMPNASPSSIQQQQQQIPTKPNEITATVHATAQGLKFVIQTNGNEVTPQLLSQIQAQLTSMKVVHGQTISFRIETQEQQQQQLLQQQQQQSQMDVEGSPNTSSYGNFDDLSPKHPNK